MIRGDTTRGDLRREQVLAWLRERPQGATAKSLSALSGLGLRYTQKVCADLVKLGVATSEERIMAATRRDGQKTGALCMVYRLAENEGNPIKRPIGVDRGRRPIAAERVDAEPPPELEKPDEWEGPPAPTERETIMHEAWHLLEHSPLVGAVTGRSTWPMAEVELVLLRAGLRALKGS